MLELLQQLHAFFSKFVEDEHKSRAIVVDMSRIDSGKHPMFSDLNGFDNWMVRPVRAERPLSPRLNRLAVVEWTRSRRNGNRKLVWKTQRIANTQHEPLVLTGTKQSAGAHSESVRSSHYTGQIDWNNWELERNMEVSAILGITLFYGAQSATPNWCIYHYHLGLVLKDWTITSA